MTTGHRNATAVLAASVIAIPIALVAAPVLAGPDGDPACAFGPTKCVPPEIHVKGMPETCTVSDFRVRIRVEHPVSLRRVRVRLDRQTLKRTNRKRFTVTVPARNLRPGDHRLRILAVDRYDVQRERKFRVTRCDPNPEIVAVRGGR